MVSRPQLTFIYLEAIGILLTLARCSAESNIRKDVNSNGCNNCTASLSSWVLPSAAQPPPPSTTYSSAAPLYLELVSSVHQHSNSYPGGILTDDLVFDTDMVVQRNLSTNGKSNESPPLSKNSSSYLRSRETLNAITSTSKVKQGRNTKEVKSSEATGSSKMHHYPGFVQNAQAAAKNSKVAVFDQNKELLRESPEKEGLSNNFASENESAQKKGTDSELNKKYLTQNLFGEKSAASSNIISEVPSPQHEKDNNRFEQKTVSRKFSGPANRKRMEKTKIKSNVTPIHPRDVNKKKGSKNDIHRRSLPNSGDGGMLTVEEAQSCREKLRNLCPNAKTPKAILSCVALHKEVLEKENCPTEPPRQHRRGGGGIRHRSNRKRQQYNRNSGGREQEKQQLTSTRPLSPHPPTHHSSSSSGRGSPWWLDPLPWWMPPPPEWGPLPPTMYVSYFHQPKAAPTTTQNYAPLYNPGGFNPVSPYRITTRTSVIEP